jgi:hypothetical protein
MPVFCGSVVNSAGAVVVLRIVSAVQIVDLDHAAGVGGVDELTVTDIDANVGKTGGIGVGEDDDIAGLQFILRNVDTGGIHTGDHTAQGITQRIVNVVNKTGTVKACGSGAAPDIGSAKILLCLVHNGLSIDITAVNGAVIVVQRIGAGNSTQRSAKTEESGIVSGCTVFIGDFRQSQLITGNVTDMIVEDDLVPAFIQTDDVSLFILFGGVENLVCSSRTGINRGAVSDKLAVT